VATESVTSAPLGLRRVLAWRHGSTNRRIFAAMVAVGIATLFGKIVAMARDMAVASFFGTSDAVDAFFIALAVPSYVSQVLTGSLPVALVPVYLRVQERDGVRAAARLLSSLVIVAGALVAVASVLLALAAPIVLPLAGATFGGAKLALTYRLFLIILPAIFISGISGVFAGVLNAHERFVLAALTPAFMSVMSMAFLLVAGHRWGIYALAIGMSVGYLAEVLVLAFAVGRRKLFAATPWRVWRHVEVREVLSQYAPLLIGAALMSSSPLIDQTMAASLGAGKVAALSYGSKIVAAGLGIAITAVTTAIFPHFSRMVATEDWAGLRHTTRTYSRLVLAGTVPTVLLIVVFSSPIIRALFERGAFTPSDTLVVANIQTLFALQIPFYVLGMIGVRLLSATGANRTLMWISIGNFVTNIVGNYICMQIWDVAGIALSTSIVYMLSATALYICVARRIRHLEGRVARSL
jgi:putative peptidoglycan lipid II flippase